MQCFVTIVFLILAFFLLRVPLLGSFNIQTEMIGLAALLMATYPALIRAEHASLSFSSIRQHLSDSHICDVPIPHGFRRTTQGLSGAPSAVRTMQYFRHDGPTHTRFRPAPVATIWSSQCPDRNVRPRHFAQSRISCCYMYEPCVLLLPSATYSNISPNAHL